MIPDWSSFMPKPSYGRILDNLGITINLRMLEMWPEYSAARDRVFGTGWLSRWWMRNVYPRLWPKRYEKRVAEWERVRNLMQQEFLNAVVEVKQRELDQRLDRGQSE